MQTVDGFTHFVNENEEIVFTLGSLFALDANGKPTDALTYDFVPVKGNDDQVIITVTLDNDYLTATDRAFPVVIDPTVTVTVSSSQTADTCVCSYFPSTNYYLGTNLRTGYDSDYGIRRSYLKFNIPTSIPAGSVTNATLDIERVAGAIPTTRAYRVTSSWSSSTLTWNTFGTSSHYDTSTPSSQSVIFREGSAWYTMNVTSIVSMWVNNTFTNHGFVVIDVNESNPDHWTTWYSSDAVSPHKPELIITYVGSGTSAPTVNADIIFDNAYELRYPSAYTRIASQAATLKAKYQEYFGITVNYTTPEIFSSYPDTYCTTSPTTQCSHGTCENSSLSLSGVVELKPYHHNNIYNMLLRIPFSNTSAYVQVAYSGHDTCEDSNTIHLLNRTLGICDPIYGRMIINNYSSVASETKTLVHEFGHLYGAPDHSGFPFTADLNASTEGAPFNSACIYGELKDSSEVMNNLTICTGCSTIIQSNRYKYSH